MAPSASRSFRELHTTYVFQAGQHEDHNVIGTQSKYDCRCCSHVRPSQGKATIPARLTTLLCLCPAPLRLRVTALGNGVSNEMAGMADKIGFQQDSTVTWRDSRRTRQRQRSQVPSGHVEPYGLKLRCLFLSIKFCEFVFAKASTG